MHHARIHSASGLMIMLRFLPDRATVEERISRFSPSYARDWLSWLSSVNGSGLYSPSTAERFSATLRRWHACRPKSVKTSAELRNVLLSAEEVLECLAGADVRAFKNPSDLHAAS